jgi:hypothetical protein
MSLLVNLGLYQVGWFAIVLGAANGIGWLGAVIALLLVGVHLALVRRPSRHLALILAAGAIGMTADSLQLQFGVLRFPNSTSARWLAPPWDAVLWIQFATILPFCLRWLSRRYASSAVVGFTGGPLAFYGGEQLGAVSFDPPRAVHFAVLAVVWALALPLLVWLSDTLVLGPGFGERYRFAQGNSDEPATDTD